MCRGSGDCAAAPRASVNAMKANFLLLEVELAAVVLIREIDRKSQQHASKAEAGASHGSLCGGIVVRRPGIAESVRSLSPLQLLEL